MPGLPAEFKASLESYQGPLDLLLYLIKKEEVDVLDIPIARITEQYLTYLTILQAVDPNACGDFLVMAANLMEIKSRSLLPTEVALEGEESEDPRIELVRQLLEYKKYKERALLLARRMEDRGRRFHRPTSPIPEASGEEGLEPLDLGNVSTWDLLTAFHRIQLALGERGPHKVLFEERPLEDYVSAIRIKGSDRIEGRLTFDELFEECQDVYDAIGYFLAILEMAKRGLLRFRQEENFGPIEIQVLETPAPGSPGASPPSEEETSLEARPAAGVEAGSSENGGVSPSGE